jgi:hypothetical protein
MHVFIYIACSNVVGKLALMALKLWMIVNWKVDLIVANFKKLSLHLRVSLQNILD